MSRGVISSVDEEWSEEEEGEGTDGSSGSVTDAVDDALAWLLVDIDFNIVSVANSRVLVETGGCQRIPNTATKCYAILFYESIRSSSDRIQPFDLTVTKRRIAETNSVNSNADDDGSGEEEGEGRRDEIYKVGIDGVENAPVGWLLVDVGSDTVSVPDSRVLVVMVKDDKDVILKIGFSLAGAIKIPIPSDRQTP
ncbi:hypothetical protein CPB86DRAFT_829279 [Serendipita vermifera]|nr:hypothetical protein CPB86DRAFT_829279 [Serendipita vermifera]